MKVLTVMACLVLLPVAATAEAEEASAGPTLATEEPAPATSSTPASPPVDSATPANDFSWGRFFLESLLGGTLGSVAAIGTQIAICDDEPCAGGSLAGLGVNLALTPLAVYGLGEMAGGDGKLGSAYWGGLIGFGAGGAGYTAGPNAGLIIGLILMPFGSALLYEASTRAEGEEVAVPALVPLYGSNGLDGVAASLAGRF